MSQVEKIEGKMKTYSQETRIALLEQSIGHVNQTLLRIENQLDKLTGGTNQKLDSLENKMDATTKWLIGIGISILFSVGTFVLSLLNHLHK